MDRKKIKSFVCVHCGYEIAAIYETGSGRQLDSPPGMKLTVLDARADAATLECPSCLAQSPVHWRDFQTKPLPPRGVVVKSG
jgi:hypothetical protein